jgi:response regulator RpfG family c-di-GMP phosphodiesterase
MSSYTSARILLVDDEPHVLDGLRRMLRSEFTIETAAGPAIALERIRESAPYAVILSDYQMPQMNGAKFLAAARAASPDTSRILLTGQADLAGAASVVNQGGILRLMLKPAGRDELLSALAAGVEQHRLITSERDLLDKTLRGCVRALTEVLGLANPAIFARSDRLRGLVAALAHAAGAPVEWHVELATMLADVGAIALPPDLLQRSERGLPLDAEEAELIAGLPVIADQILAGIPRIEEVRAAILSQGARYDGLAESDRRAGEDIPLGGRVLRLAQDFDSLELLGTDPVRALAMLRDRHGAYDPALLDALAVVVSERADREPRCVSVFDLVPGMVLAADVVTAGGLKLVARGSELSPALLTRIRSYAGMSTGVDEPIPVYLPAVARIAVGSSAS